MMRIRWSMAYLDMAMNIGFVDTRLYSDNNDCRTATTVRDAAPWSTPPAWLLWELPTTHAPTNHVQPELVHKREGGRERETVHEASTAN